MADEDTKNEKDEKKVTFHQGNEVTDEEGKGRNQQKEFFKEELRRLQTDLKKEASQIHKPTEKPFMPFVWTSLKSYCDTYTVAYLIGSEDGMSPRGYKTRKTATGLCDPWVDFHMDSNVQKEVASTQDEKTKTCEAETLEEKDQPIKNEKGKKEDNKTRPPKEGSTRLPKYPVVRLETEELATKKLDYGDVPMLREELRQKYSLNAKEKIQQDYVRTKQDFYRMQLDKLQDVHPLNRQNMRQTYFAYLQNTPGSRKAIRDCVKTLED